ncbi:IclR family transcriptional regulator [Streptomyces meridianus]|uniref:IclR family transcriptional regulator n=1 Tax=Streptomyces meridianus TaxID=2938945 RepID=A0ABT0XC90_9ACTN|nr:IclR family transcriptional regulator [Streptomyces meridianus]MCM2579995.1 IclR family transcriptional regulator [Streptomyces meridianus]
MPDSAAPSDMVGKALHVLGMLGRYPSGAVLSELARTSGFPTSTCYRLLKSLARDRFVEFDPRTKRYTLGLRVYQLGQSVSQAHGFTGIALPVMRRLAELTREAVLMAVPDGDRMIYIHHVQGPQQVSVQGEPGRHGPLHCTSMGKVLVAFSPEREREHLLESIELTPLGPNAIVERSAFRAEIDRTRTEHHAVADEEHEPGIRALGVPILGADGTARAALSVAAPAYRMDLPELLRLRPALTNAAQELAVLLPSGAY